MLDKYKAQNGAIERDHGETGVVGEDLLDNTIIWTEGGQIIQPSLPLLLHYEKRNQTLVEAARKTKDKKGADYLITLADRDGTI